MLQALLAAHFYKMKSLILKHHSNAISTLLIPLCEAWLL
jgi:hypothetical protein